MKPWHAHAVLSLLCLIVVNTIEYRSEAGPVVGTIMMYLSLAFAISAAWLMGTRAK